MFVATMCCVIGALHHGALQRLLCVRRAPGKSPEEIRATFNLPDDLTEEEKLEPLKSGLADARIKLLNKLYAKKRQVRQKPSRTHEQCSCSVVSRQQVWSHVSMEETL